MKAAQEAVDTSDARFVTAAESDEEEILLTAFAMENPEGEPQQGDFSMDDFNAAHDVAKFTSVVDQRMRIVVGEHDEALVDRDVLMTYKAIVYRAVRNGNQARSEARNWKHIALALGVGLVVIAIFSFNH